MISGCKKKQLRENQLNERKDYKRKAAKTKDQLKRTTKRKTEENQ